MSKGEKRPRKEAEEIAWKFLAHIDAVRWGLATITGSIRREKEMVGDIDIVLMVDDEARREGLNRALMQLWGALKTPKLRHRARRGGMFEGMQIQLMDVTAMQVGAAMLHTTGSWEWNVVMRSKAMQNGWKLNQYGLWCQVTNEAVVEATTEEAIFDALGMKYRPPKDRVVED